MTTLTALVHGALAALLARAKSEDATAVRAILERDGAFAHREPLLWWLQEATGIAGDHHGDGPYLLVTDWSVMVFGPRVAGPREQVTVELPRCVVVAMGGKVKQPGGRPPKGTPPKGPPEPKVFSPCLTCGRVRLIAARAVRYGTMRKHCRKCFREAA